MSFKSEKEARVFGDKVWAKLKGKGWTIRVWKNLGWYVCWYLGRIALHCNTYGGKDSFWCLISDVDDSHHGCSAWTSEFHSEDPNEAVAHDIAHAINVCNTMMKGLTESRTLLKGYQKELIKE